MLIAQRPVISSTKITDNRYKFEIDSLEPGFGYTLGNSLRRTLLSSIPGAAVTSIKIEGAKHEFEALKGVKEDVTEIILNIKSLAISSTLDDPTTVFLHADKAGVVKAKDIKVSAGIEIHNPDQVIATVADKGSLDIEFVIERGRGYVSADINKMLMGEMEAGRIAIDSIYSPVLKVTYDVKATRVGQRTDFDKLIIDVETKPSMSPVDAFVSAGKTLVELFGLVGSMPTDGAVDFVEVGTVQAAPLEDDTIESLGLGTRSVNGLDRAGIHSISELAKYTLSQLSALDNIGASSIKEITEALTARGLALAAE